MKSYSRMSRLSGLIIMLLAACQNEGRWYPEAEVSIGNHTEYSDATGGRGLAVTLIVHNTSKTSITSSTITVKVTTTSREYLQTAGFTNKIVPDGKVALTVSVAYLEASEQVLPDGIRLYDSFFD